MDPEDVRHDTWKKHIKATSKNLAEEYSRNPVVPNARTLEINRLGRHIESLKGDLRRSNNKEEQDKLKEKIYLLRVKLGELKSAEPDVLRMKG